MRTLLPSLLLLCLLRPGGAQRWRNSSGSLTRLTAAKLQPVSGRGQCDYCQISSTNTYCRYGASSGPGASCGTTLYGKVDPATRQEILDAHNDLRGKIARGEEPLLQGVTAGDMRELAWDEELARGAQLWADQCTWSHDSNDVCRFRVGQNLFQRGTFNHDSVEEKVTPDWRKACFEWYDEVRVPGLHGMDPTKWTGGSYLGIGHFTQLIWASTELVGCGYIVYNRGGGGYDTQYYVCNYGPAGNYNGQRVYAGGATCSSCPEGTSCSSRGLCARSTGGATTPATTASTETTAPSEETPGTIGEDYEDFADYEDGEEIDDEHLIDEDDDDDYWTEYFTFPPLEPPGVIESESTSESTTATTTADTATAAPTEATAEEEGEEVAEGAEGPEDDDNCPEFHRECDIEFIRQYLQNCSMEEHFPDILAQGPRAFK